MESRNEPKTGGRFSKGLTRRAFLATVGAGAAAAAVSGGLSPLPAKGATIMKAGEMKPLSLMVNDRRFTLLVEPRWSLLYVLRERLGLTGTKVGCNRGECGACTVLIDDLPKYACLTLAVEVEGKRITTVEGLMKGEDLGPVQQAFLEEDALQCGYCTPGQIMAAEGFLRRRPEFSVEEIPKAMSGNLCRCGAYLHIFRAVERAAGLRKA